MKMTIKEIAKLAGVSQATVSKIINNYDDVGMKTKERVLALMDEHGYRPSYAAQSLVKKVTKVIGVIYAGKINANFNHPFFVEVVSTFKKTMGAEGYDLLFFSNEKFHKADENYLQRCQHYNVDGCIIIGGEHVEPSVDDLVQSDIPCIGVDIQLDGPHSGYIMTDNNQVSALAVEHFYLSGQREIAFIGGAESSLISNEREKGFRERAKAYGLQTPDDWIVYGDFFEDSGYKQMNELLKKERTPRAIFAISDLMAIGAMRAIKDQGLDIREFAIIGCDDITAARHVEPPLTTIRQDKDKIGRMAAYILKDLIQGNIERTSLKVEPDLIVRESTGHEIGSV
ncbi:LacI family DNA-binding transcriptional regulator [Salisediminibacterium beveridgei]|uniref:Transcriptional regulator, LacI family n=1 Tax=Salisediminibacterium beveridgei TaxID=632773 RepID=A0A1D7QZ98_9BACI|nr:LacI family DNA-binding transcriptional regulator [Salisediminibacterium beveridgei]AOM84337.1 transcriptional regulator, LacI family [Salisediminibacterium beveridgei]